MKQGQGPAGPMQKPLTAADSPPPQNDGYSNKAMTQRRNPAAEEPDFDALVVGQGMAGSLLTLALQRRGWRVKLLAGTGPSASRVSAGICNPVTGRQLVLTWQAQALFAFLHRYYPALETELGLRFFYPIDHYRPFRDIGEQNHFLARTASPGLEAYVYDDEAADTLYNALIFNRLGGLHTRQVAWLNWPRLLDALHDRFSQQQILFRRHLNWAELRPAADGVHWQGRRYRFVLSCEGAAAALNPYFSYLPWHVAKGEMLQVRWAGGTLPGMVHQGIWVLPQPDGTHRVGATYDHQHPDTEPTAAGRQWLENRLRPLLGEKITVAGHVAGLRPATRDRRPFVGLHPVYKNIGILGGMGSKGTSLTPYFAEQLADLLSTGKELDPAANIERYVSLSFHKE